MVIAAAAGAADLAPAVEAAGAVRRADNDDKAADSAVDAAGNLAGAVSKRGAAVTAVERAGAAVSGRCSARTGGALFGLLIAPDTVMGAPSASLSWLCMKPT
jgi:hypothetical protein